jgi:hypothetical protein
MVLQSINYILSFLKKHCQFNASMSHKVLSILLFSQLACKNQTSQPTTTTFEQKWNKKTDLEALISDITIAESAITLQSFQQKQDSLANILYPSILKKHNLSVKEYESFMNELLTTPQFATPKFDLLTRRLDSLSKK